MPGTASYRTCAGPSRDQLRVKGSRFLALLEPCADRTEAEGMLAGLRRQYHDATHICWAWRLLSEPEPGEASSDAGEPAGTAGVPMLGVLKANDLWNVLGVVLRWYGGTKLGKGGLIRAYRESLTGAVARAEVVEVVPKATVVVSSALDGVGDIHRLLSMLDVEYLNEVVEGDEVKVTVSLPARDMDMLVERVLEATRGGGSVSPLRKGRL